ncbi:hypothetical protein HDU97_002921 [Phlyctochytrium planicorne]|nr:hypothetical protein HDU97_002921 [Phlyctochytrium planicorne]
MVQIVPFVSGTYPEISLLLQEIEEPGGAAHDNTMETAFARIVTLAIEGFFGADGEDVHALSSRVSGLVVGPAVTVVAEDTQKSRKLTSRKHFLVQRRLNLYARARASGLNHAMAAGIYANDARNFHHHFHHHYFHGLANQNAPWVNLNNETGNSGSVSGSGSGSGSGSSSGQNWNSGALNGSSSFSSSSASPLNSKQSSTARNDLTDDLFGVLFSKSGKPSNNARLWRLPSAFGSLPSSTSSSSNSDRSNDRPVKSLLSSSILKDERGRFYSNDPVEVEAHQSSSLSNLNLLESLASTPSTSLAQDNLSSSPSTSGRLSSSVPGFATLVEKDTKWRDLEKRRTHKDHKDIFEIGKSKNKRSNTRMRSVSRGRLESPIRTFSNGRERPSSPMTLPSSLTAPSPLMAAAIPSRKGKEPAYHNEQTFEIQDSSSSFSEAPRDVPVDDLSNLQPSRHIPFEAFGPQDVHSRIYGAHDNRQVGSIGSVERDVSFAADLEAAYRMRMETDRGADGETMDTEVDMSVMLMRGSSSTMRVGSGSREGSFSGEEMALDERRQLLADMEAYDQRLRILMGEERAQMRSGSDSPRLRSNEAEPNTRRLPGYLVSRFPNRPPPRMEPTPVSIMDDLNEYLLSEDLDEVMSSFAMTRNLQEFHPNAAPLLMQQQHHHHVHHHVHLGGGPGQVDPSTIASGSGSGVNLTDAILENSEDAFDPGFLDGGVVLLGMDDLATNQEMDPAAAGSESETPLNSARNSSDVSERRETPSAPALAYLEEALSMYTQYRFNRISVETSSLLRIAQSCPKLKCLNLAFSPLSVDYLIRETGEYLSSLLVEPAEYLTRVPISAADAMKAIGHGCRELVALDLMGCEWVTQGVVEAFLVVAPRSLRAINLVRCQRIKVGAAKLFLARNGEEIRDVVGKAFSS